MFRTKKTDYLAVALSLLLLPLFFNRPGDGYLFYVASNVQIYSDSYNKQVKAPVAFLNVKMAEELPNVPYLLFPAYSFSREQPISDFVRFINFYKELLYGYRYSTPFYSPYVKQRNLFTYGQIVQETYFKDAAYLRSVGYNSSGRIIYYSNYFKNYIAGLTENFEVFLSDNSYYVFSSARLADDFTFAFERLNVQSYFSPKIRVCERGILVSVSGIGESAAYVFTGMLDFSGNKLWFKDALIPRDKLNFSDKDSLIREVNLQHDVLKPKNSFALLAYCLRSIDQERTHGETIFFAECGNSTLYLGRQLVYIYNISTGDELASFLIFPGVALSKGQDPNSFGIHFISDEGMREAARSGKLDKYKFKFDALSYKLEGESLKDLRISFAYAAILSENHDYVENAMHIGIDEFTPILTPITPPLVYSIGDHTAVVYLAPNGVLYQVDAESGTMMWKAPIPDFMATTMNTHLSVYNMGSQKRLVILSIGHRIIIFDAYSGTFKNMWMIPETIDVFDSAEFSYNDGTARTKVQVQTANIHPYLDKRSLFIMRDGYMDVLQLSDSTISLVDFWERLGLLALTSIFLAVVLRSFEKDGKKE